MEIPAEILWASPSEDLASEPCLCWRNYIFRKVKWCKVQRLGLKSNATMSWVWKWKKLCKWPTMRFDCFKAWSFTLNPLPAGGVASCLSLMCQHWNPFTNTIEGKFAKLEGEFANELFCAFHLQIVEDMCCWNPIVNGRKHMETCTHDTWLEIMLTWKPFKKKTSETIP